MKKQFSFIFLGLIFVMIDVWIKGYDVVPDVVGYILIGLGTSGLQPYSIHFVTARNLSWALAVFTLMLIFVRGQAFFFSDLVVRVIDLGFFWFLLGGIRELALSKDRKDLAAAASRDRIIYIVLMLSTALGILLFKDRVQAMGTFQLVVQVGLLIVLILILNLVRESRKYLTSEPIISASEPDSPASGS